MTSMLSPLTPAESTPPFPTPALLDAALAALTRGWSLLPVNAGGEHDKKPHPVLLATRHAIPKDGRQTTTWAPLQLTPPTEAQVRECASGFATSAARASRS